MKVDVHIPMPQPITYDLLGLTEAQYDKICLLLGEVTCHDTDTSGVFDEMYRKRQPFCYRLITDKTRPVRFEATK